MKVRILSFGLEKYVMREFDNNSYGILVMRYVYVRTHPPPKVLLVNFLGIIACKLLQQGADAFALPFHFVGGVATYLH